MTTELVPVQPADVAQAVHTAADFTISASTRQRIYDAFSPNTRRAYERIGEHWFAWCTAAGRRPLPATAETLADYIGHLADLGKRGPSLEQAISAIRTIHEDSGYHEQPGTYGARKVVKQVRKATAAAGHRVKEAPPLLVEHVQAMIDLTDPASLVGKRDRAMLVLGIMLCGRRSELTALHISDITEHPDGLDVLIRMSKTDQEAKGEQVWVPAGKEDSTNPVLVVRNWLDALTERGVTEGPLLRAVTRWDALHPSGQWSPEKLNERVKALALRAGIPHAPKYSAHSLRAGGLTSALMAGATLAQGARQGRWNLNSPVVLRYDRAVDRKRNNPMQNIGF